MYLDTCHIVKLLEQTSLQYEELSKFICKSNVDLLISDFALIELSQANNESLYKRGIEASKYNFLYLKTYTEILKLEIEYYLNKTQISPVTKDILNVLPIPNREILPPDFNLTVAQFLINQQEFTRKPNHELFDAINSRDRLLEFEDAWKTGGIEKYLKGLSLEKKQTIKPQDTPSYTLYIYIWCTKNNNIRQRLKRNDLFDTLHCRYIPYVDCFITDNGNAAHANSALKKLNKEIFSTPIKTKVFKSVQDFLTSEK